VRCEFRVGRIDKNVLAIIIDQAEMARLHVRSRHTDAPDVPVLAIQLGKPPNLREGKADKRPCRDSKAVHNRRTCSAVQRLLSPTLSS